jgi:hypothetical protein
MKLEGRFIRQQILKNNVNGIRENVHQKRNLKSTADEMRGKVHQTTNLNIQYLNKR